MGYIKVLRILINLFLNNLSSLLYKKAELIIYPAVSGMPSSSLEYVQVISGKAIFFLFSRYSLEKKNIGAIATLVCFNSKFSFLKFNALDARQVELIVPAQRKTALVFI